MKKREIPFGEVFRALFQRKFGKTPEKPEGVSEARWRAILKQGERELDRRAEAR